MHSHPFSIVIGSHVACCPTLSLQIGVITPYEGQRAHVVAAMLRNGTLRQDVYKEIEVIV